MVQLGTVSQRLITNTVAYVNIPKIIYRYIPIGRVRFRLPEDNPQLYMMQLLACKKKVNVRQTIDVYPEPPGLLCNMPWSELSALRETVWLFGKLPFPQLELASEYYCRPSRSARRLSSMGKRIRAKIARSEEALRRRVLAKL